MRNVQPGSIPNLRAEGGIVGVRYSLPERRLLVLEESRMESRRSDRRPQ